MNNRPKYFTVPEAAVEMMTSEKTVRRRIADRKITYHKEGGRILIRPIEVDRYMERVERKAKR